MVDMVESGGFPKTYDEELLKNHKDAGVKKIVGLVASKENKEVLYKKYIAGTTPSGRAKRDIKEQEWLDFALELPFDKKIEYPITSKDDNIKIHEFLFHMKRKLDDAVHGMSDAKEEILLEVMKRMTNPEMPGKILILDGAPGNTLAVF